MSSVSQPFGRLWGIQDWLEHLVGATLQLEGNLPIKGDLHLDSRKVKQGDAFLAMKGHDEDGHHYIDQAIKAGCMLILAESALNEAQIQLVSDSQRTVIIDPLLREHHGALAQAFYGFPAQECTLIGVTGTNGKTTVATLLCDWYQALEIPASMIGTTGIRVWPEATATSTGLTTADAITLAKTMRTMVDTGTTHIVMEVSSHALDQARVGGLQFDGAIFTNLSQDHLDYHASMEAYARAKAKLFRGLAPEAVAVINRGDKVAPIMTEGCNATIIDLEMDVSVFVTEVASDYTGIKIEALGQHWDLKTPLIGEYNAMNVAQAFVMANALGTGGEDGVAAGADSKILQADWTRVLASSHGAPGRLEKITPPALQADEKELFPTVFVDYAHTPDALRTVLQTLQHWVEQKPGEQGKLWVIFGAGGDRDALKRPKMGAIAEEWADVVILTNDNPRSESPKAIAHAILSGFASPEAVETNVRVILDRREAIQTAIMEARPSDVILVAGKGHETTMDIEGIRHPFSDIDEVHRAYQNRHQEVTHAH
ncbi:MAG: UDP-N-acetylmuramoyl-L-alanyl-D-glutamate--2,6-diaminopimelate ligase [Bacteroidetes bacterium]|nr:UDP-N-acetylmuramoyl-L-alanyl-D-glutamate--2,6-diaminopimelate ligase [Bacteroidota bacterium]